MRVTISWPWGKEEEQGYPEAIAFPDDQITVLSLDREGGFQPREKNGVSFLNIMPDVDRADRNKVLWAINRVRVYTHRAKQIIHYGKQSDFVHIYYLNNFTDLFVIRALKKHTKIVITVHDATPHVNRMGSLQEPWLSTLYRSADRILVHERAVLKKLTKEYGVKHIRISLVPLPVYSIEGIDEYERVDSKNILVFGALRENKGILQTIDGFKRWDDPEARLKIAGRGPLAGEIRNAIENDSRISFENDFISSARKKELFLEANVVSLLYRDFFSGSAVLLDAYAYRVPVLTSSEDGSVSKEVENLGTGLTCKMYDPGDVAEKMKQITEDPKVFLESITRESKKRSVERVASETRKLYRNE